MSPHARHGCETAADLMGTAAIIRDSEGNRLGLLEPPSA